MYQTSKTYPTKRTFAAADLVYIALASVLIAICSWISIPTQIPFTLQTFAIFCVISVLGGRRGAAAVIVYLLLGAIGIPVFAGFKGGIGAILGTTGGYMVGFLFICLAYWLATGLFGKKLWVEAVSLIVGLLVCYAFGTAWFMLLYARTSGSIGIMTALGWCVFPFILPDLIKLALALSLARRIPAVPER